MVMECLFPREHVIYIYIYVLEANLNMPGGSGHASFQHLCVEDLYSCSSKGWIGQSSHDILLVAMLTGCCSIRALYSYTTAKKVLWR